jgi:Heterokaryon incompatibility protein (HET)
MRLINVKTFKLEEFLDPSKIPPYAILSHVWGEEEVLNRNMLDLEKLNTTRGFEKIKMTCQLAIADGLDWAWVDTCCIDKSSTAELSEAINSMFRWFRHSRVCYVYLEDVRDGDFHKSRWFTRGWTLLELIAPRELRFFNFSWKYLDSKADLIKTLASITNVPQSCLRDVTNVGFCSIAERMSWASSRRTTRPEDMAYCLMGLFDVNMLILYGEGGDKAFLRLQEVILKNTTDQSFLAWRVENTPSEFPIIRSLPTLAVSPALFNDRTRMGRVRRIPEYGNRQDHKITLSNVGVCFRAPVIKTLGDRLVFAVLNCQVNPYRDIWLPLWKTRRQSYRRIDFPQPILYVSTAIKRQRVVPTKILLEDSFRLCDILHESHPLHAATQPESIAPISTKNNSVGAVVTCHSEKQSFSSSLSFTHPPTPLNEDDSFGTVWLDRTDENYYHGLIVFKVDTKQKNRVVGIFFAAVFVTEGVDEWTCRVLLDVNDTSTNGLAVRSKVELDKICNEQIVPMDAEMDFKSPIWRTCDQNGNTFVQLDFAKSGRFAIAQVVFDVPTQASDLSASLAAAFEKHSLQETLSPTV